MTYTNKPTQTATAEAERPLLYTSDYVARTLAQMNRYTNLSTYGERPVLLTKNGVRLNPDIIETSLKACQPRTRIYLKDVHGKFIHIASRWRDGWELKDEFHKAANNRL